MKWSLPLGRFAGIRVQVHVTFLLLLAWIGFSIWSTQHDVGAVLAGIGFVLALFLCVVLHEFGHALTARRFGVGTRDITLLPIGGVARLEKMPERPMEELLVAVAGPAVNVVIALVLGALLSAMGQPLTLDAMAVGGEGGGTPGVLQQLLGVNVLLVAFNLLPAFPMDGGRVLRALFAMRMPYALATERAAAVGKLFAVLFAVVGFFSNPFLMLIGVFVWFGATQESMAAQVRGVLDGITVAHAMITDYRTLAESDTLGHAVELLLAGSQQDFPVLHGNAVVGVLTRQSLLTALARREEHLAVGDVMTRPAPTATIDEPLEAALQRMQRSPLRTMPVLQQGVLAGLLTMENVGEFVSVQSALRRSA